MKKNLFFAAAAMSLMLASCHSTDSAYKKAYEKAKAQEAAQQVSTAQDEPVVAPVQTVPAAQTAPTTPATSVADENGKRENLTVVDGAPLKAYSVVVGAFGVKANAERTQQTLKNKGYSGAVIVFNEQRNLYRVVAATFDNRADAVSVRNQLSTEYEGAWLLLPNE